MSCSIQRQSGFVSSALLPRLRTSARGRYVRALLHQMCFCDVEYGREGTSNLDSITSVANNLIARGAPTTASCQVERALAEGLELTRETDDLVAVDFSFRRKMSEADAKGILSALAIVDP